MKFQLESTCLVTVTYFGLVLIVGEEYSHIATDSDGRIYAYTCKPSRDVNEFTTENNPDAGPAKLLLRAGYLGDWEASCKKISKLPEVTHVITAKQ